MYVYTHTEYQFYTHYPICSSQRSRRKTEHRTSLFQFQMLNLKLREDCDSPKVVQRKQN